MKAGISTIPKYKTICIILFLCLICGIASGTTYLEKYQSYNKLLLHANQSPDFPNYFNDSSPQGHIGSTVGTLTTLTSNKAWGNASMNNEGTSVGVYFTDSPDWDCSSSDCTWLFWLNYIVGSNVDRMHISMTGLSGSNQETAIYSKGTGELAIGITGVNEIQTSGANLQSNSWYQIVVKRNQTSGRTTMFVNGTERLNTTTSVWQNSAQPLTVGGGYYASVRGTNGLMDEVGFWKTDIPIEDLWPQTAEVGTPSNSYALNANFTISNTSGFTPLLTHFTDTSTTNQATIDSWNWSFGDGNISTSQNPDHTYVIAGTHSINLTITNTSYSLVSTKIQNVTVYNVPPVANFISNQTIGSPPMAVQFTDMSTGSNITSWNWTFGDGNLSTSQNPIYTYNYIGEYQVNLTVTNDGGSSTKLSNITVANFGAYFTANTTSGPIPLSILFSDVSIGNYNSWNWSIEEVTHTWFNTTNPVLKNLTYTFNNAGNWRVNLSVQNITLSGPIYTNSMNITATNVAPVASFTKNNTYGTPSTVFGFTDTSTGINITSRNWSFGDGNVSSLQNPTHIFPAGTYNVNLTVTNDGGSSTSIQTVYISSFSSTYTANKTFGITPMPVQFTETTTGLLPDSYYWEFGDGGTSIVQNPEHTFNVGTFNIAHRVTNGSTIAWFNTTNMIRVEVGNITPSFSANRTTGAYNLPVQFTDTSITTNATIDSWNWNFGDSGTSTLQNPEHTFTSLGNFTVVMTVSNSSYGSTSATRYINTTSPSGVTRQDLEMSPAYTLVVTFTDAVTGSIVPNVAVSDSNGYSANATYGVYTNTYPYSIVTIYYSANGYVSGSRTFSITGDLVQTIAMTPTSKTTSSKNVLWAPQTVAIQILDSNNNPIRGTSVNTIAVNSTLPGGLAGAVTYFENTYGVPEETAVSMLSRDTTYSGTTDSYGYVVIQMTSVIEYRITVIDALGYPYIVTTYPQSTWMQITTPNSTSPSAFAGSATANTILANSVYVANLTENGAGTLATLQVFFYDASHTSTSLNCWFKAPNSTTFWQNSTFAPTSGLKLCNMTVPTDPFTTWRWGANSA